VVSENTDFSVECVTRARTSVLRGVVRLEHEAAWERVFSAVSADFDATGPDAYTIDVSEVVFMNSSAIRALATLVLSAKRARRRLSIVGRRSVPWQDRTLGSLSALYDGLEVRLTSPAKVPTLRREQEVWTIETPEGRTLRFKDAKGFVYLDLLFCQPERELHVLEIIGVDIAGDAGPVLDERAKAEYRERLAALREELAEAERFHDGLRASRAGEELEALTTELARAVGLGGRDRRIASDVQRARVNVQRCLKEVLKSIAKADPTLGRYLAATIKTGTYCSFKPL
jgi:hypothetical protein